MWSSRQLVTLYLVDIHLAYGTLPGMEVIGIDSEDDEHEVILGRNVLNLLILLLDGPQQQTTILERRPRRF